MTGQRLKSQRRVSLRRDGDSLGLLGGAVLAFVVMALGFLRDVRWTTNAVRTVITFLVGYVLVFLCFQVVRKVAEPELAAAREAAREAEREAERAAVEAALGVGDTYESEASLDAASDRREEG